MDERNSQTDKPEFNQIPTRQRIHQLTIEFSRVMPLEKALFHAPMAFLREKHLNAYQLSQNQTQQHSS
jgi:hypothetical protein